MSLEPTAPRQILPDGQPRRLVRSELRDGSGQTEAWFQQLLEADPDILPIADIDPSFAGAVTVGSELVIAPGNRVDSLLLNSDGAPTIVEAKLWKNPEALRKVVAQIVEYAAILSRMSYEELEAVCRPYLDKQIGNASLASLFIPENDELAEARFIDSVQSHLSSGRLLLLIVGDGIRQRLGKIVEFLETSQQFRLGLVELASYESPDDPGLGRVIVPRVALRTEEVVTRVVVSVSQDGVVDAVLKPERPDPAPSASRKRGPTAPAVDLEDFFKMLEDEQGAEARRRAERIFREVEDLSPEIEPIIASKQISLRLADATEQRRALHILSLRLGDDGAYAGFCAKPLTTWDLDGGEVAHSDFLNGLAQSVPGSKIKDTERSGSYWHLGRRLGGLTDPEAQAIIEQAKHWAQRVMDLAGGGDEAD